MNIDPSNLDPEQQELFKFAYQQGMNDAVTQVRNTPPPMYADTAAVHVNPNAFHLEFSWVDGSGSMGINKDVSMGDIPRRKVSYLIVPPVALKTMLEQLVVCLKRYEHQYGEVVSVASVEGVGEGVIMEVPVDRVRADMQPLSERKIAHKEQEVEDTNEKQQEGIRRYEDAMKTGEIDTFWLECKYRRQCSEEYGGELPNAESMIIRLVDNGFVYNPGVDPTERSMHECRSAKLQMDYRRTRLLKAYSLGHIGALSLGELLIEEGGGAASNHETTADVIEALALLGYVYEPDDCYYTMTITEVHHEQSKTSTGTDEASGLSGGGETA